MIPNVLQALIHRYNEYGTFIRTKQRVYWFNGIRFEYWCNSEMKVLYFKNQLYTKSSEFGFISIYSKKKFVDIPCPNYFLLKLFQTECIWTCRSGYKINFNNVRNMTTNQQIALPRYISSLDAHIYLNDFIYLFKGDTNLKYNFKTNTFSKFSVNPNLNVKSDFYDIFNIGNLIYDITENQLDTYDPSTDVWTTRIVNL